MRRYAFFLFSVVMLMGFGLFQLKYHVVQLEEKLVMTEKKIAERKEAIHVLKAEWSHLNDPQRLQRLANTHLQMSPIQSFQLISLQDLMGLPEDQNTESPGAIPSFLFTKAEES